MNIDALLGNLRKNRYEASYFATADEAKAYLNEKIDGRTVGIGDSMTLYNMGVYDSLRTHNTVYDVQHTPGGTLDEFWEYSRKTQDTEIFLCSLNALSEDGILVNMDGAGNRVAASLFGHEKVYYVVGINKVCPDLHSAIRRIRTVAAPQNARRKKMKTPCAATGKCVDCDSPARICNALVIEYKKMIHMKAEVVIIGEELGL